MRFNSIRTCSIEIITKNHHISSSSSKALRRRSKLIFPTRAPPPPPEPLEAAFSNMPINACSLTLCTRPACAARRILSSSARAFSGFTMAILLTASKPEKRRSRSAQSVLGRSFRARAMNVVEEARIGRAMNTHVSLAPRAPKRSLAPRLVALRFRVVFPSQAPVPPRSRRHPPECPTTRAETIDASRRHRRHRRQSRVVARRVTARVTADVRRAQKSTRRQRRRSRVARASRASLAIERAPVALACSRRHARVSLDRSRAHEDEAAPTTAVPHSQTRAIMSREGCVARRVRPRCDRARLFHRRRRVRARVASPRACRKATGRWGNDFTMNSRRARRCAPCLERCPTDDDVTRTGRTRTRRCRSFACHRARWFEGRSATAMPWRASQRATTRETSSAEGVCG